MNSEERKKYIFLMLFYYESDYLSVNHFLSALRVGKTTFMADIKKLEKEQIDLTDEMIKSKEDGTPNEDLKDYLIELNAKIEICKNQVTNQTEPQIEEPQLNRKIILSSQIKKDIKDIPKEEYNHLLNAFDL